MRKTVQIRDKLKKEYAKISFSDEMIRRFQFYFELLCRWNSKINLTAVRDVDQMIDKHLLDSLAVHKSNVGDSLVYPHPGRLMDIGSGAGLPGVLLQIANPNLHVHSIDASQKKIGFQEVVKAQLKLLNLEPLHARVEDLAKCSEFRLSMDFIVSRAFHQIKDLFTYSRIFLKPDGFLIAWKGQSWQQEISAVSKELRDQFQLLESVSYQFTDSMDGGRLLVFKQA